MTFITAILSVPRRRHALAAVLLSLPTQAADAVGFCQFDNPIGGKKGIEWAWA